MKTTFVFLVVVAVLVSLCSAQTFQYSRGWTNGKRSVGVDLDSKVRTLCSRKCDSMDFIVFLS